TFKKALSFRWGGAEVWRGDEPAEISSSSSDLGSNLRGPSYNDPRVVSKRVVKIRSGNWVAKVVGIKVPPKRSPEYRIIRASPLPEKASG
ncbi:hypothetical protein AVEN_186539-1, partial [Araneus ventricosus]